MIEDSTTLKNWDEKVSVSTQFDGAFVTLIDGL